MIDDLKNKIVIRASSTSSYMDCARRVAADIFRNDIEAAGYVLNETPNNIGACIGTSVHSCMEYTLKNKMEHDNLGHEDEAVERALDTLDKETDGYVIFDKVNNTREKAERQVIRKSKAFRQNVAPLCTPTAVEVRLEAEYRGDFIISGQADWREDSKLRDLKTGKFHGDHTEQFGVYSMLAKSHNFNIDSIEEVWMQMVDLKEPEPDVAYTEYKVDACEEAAVAVLNRMIDDYDKFMETKDRWSFMPNPSSLLCSAKFCRAYATDFCKEHRKPNR